MNIFVVGKGRIGTGISQFSKRNGHSVKVVNSSLDWIETGKIDIVFIAVNPKYMRGSISLLLDFIFSKVDPNTVIAVPFDIERWNINHKRKQHLIRFSTTPAIGSNVKWSNVFIQSDASERATQKLMHWVKGLKVTELQSQDFDEMEKRYALCGVICKFFEVAEESNQIEISKDMKITILKESMNLIHFTNGNARRAYELTATPNGLVESMSIDILKGA